MNPKFVLLASSALGLLSVLLYNLSAFRKSKIRFVGMQVGCDICDILVYLITGGRSGVANSIVNLCKDTVYAKYSNHILTIFFACMKIGLLVLSYESILTILFILIEIVITIILLKGTVQQLRCAHLCEQTIWMIYDYMFANIFIAAITATSCISLISAIIKNRNSCKEHA